MFRLPWAASLVSSLTAALVCAWPAQSLAQDGAAPRFDIFEFRIEGNTVLEVQKIERAVYAFMGERRSIDDVENARATLESVYREAGFGTVAVDTPEQRVEGGVVVLQVREAPVSRLRVLGAKFYSQGRILDKVPGLAEGQVPNFKAVSTQMAAVNTSADRRVTPLLRPGKEPGTTEVDLNVKDRLPLHGSVRLTNHHSEFTTASRLEASLRYDNLWQREHSLSLGLQVSPQKTSEVGVISASYTVPAEGGPWIFSALHSDSTVPTAVLDNRVAGKGNVFGLRRNLLLESSARSYQSLTLGVDYKDFAQVVGAGIGAEASSGISSPIRYLPFSANWLALFSDDKGRWQAGAGLTFAVRGLASNEQQFEDKRFGGQGNFAYLKADLSREYKLLGERGLTLFGKVELQVANQPLIGNEQIVAGGASSVRGYLESAAVGDDALRASFELRSAALLAGRWAWLQQLQLQAFVDGANLRLRMPLPGQDPHVALLGAGLGLRAGLAQGVSLAVDAAWPLVDLRAGDRLVQKKYEPRLHVSGAFEF